MAYSACQECQVSWDSCSDEHTRRNVAWETTRQLLQELKMLSAMRIEVLLAGNLGHHFRRKGIDAHRMQLVLRCMCPQHTTPALL